MLFTSNMILDLFMYFDDTEVISMKIREANNKNNTIINFIIFLMYIFFILIAQNLMKSLIEFKKKVL